MLAVLTALWVSTDHEGVIPEGLHVKGHGECNALDMSAYCQFRGFAAVGLALGIFLGLPLLILATNVGVRKASGVILGTLFAYLTIHGFLWMIYPRGPIVAATNPDGSPRKLLGLPNTIGQRMPAILLLLGAGALTAIICAALNRIDRPRTEEGMIIE